MKSFKIATRLVVGFAAVIAITATFGAFAYTSAASIDQAANHLGKVTLPAAYLSEDLRSNVQKQYALFEQFIATSDRTELDRLDAAIAAERSRNADALAKFETLVLNERQRGYLESLRAARDAYSASFDVAMNLARTGTDEARRLAAEMDTQSIRSAYARYLGYTDAMVTASRGAADEQRSAGDLTNPATPSGILICMAFAVVLSIVIALIVIGSVTRPITQAVEAFEQVSSGSDLTCRASVKSDDELGDLLTGINRHLDIQANAVKMADQLADGDFSGQGSATSDRDILGQSIVRMRNSLQASFELAEKILAGDLTSQTRSIAEGDKLAGSLVKIRESLKRSGEAAKKIAEGDLVAQVKPAFPGDLIGQSLLRIRENLLNSTQLAIQLSQGNLTAEAGAVSTKDPLNHSLVTLKDHLSASAQLINKLSEGDLTVQTTAASDNDVLGSAVTRLVGSLRRIVGDMAASVSNVAGVGTEIVSTAGLLAEGTGEHTAASAETTLVIGGMAASLRNNIENSQQTDQLAFAVAQDGKLGSEALGQMVTAMQEVAEKINVLDEISRKSDMLTLAAAVEAARAGEHGLGFGVVASELRKLGDRQQTTAAEIIRLTSGGVKTAESAGELLAKLGPSVSRAAELVREIASNSMQQTTGVTRANQAVMELDRVIHQNVSASRQMASTAEQLVSQTNTLQSTIRFFKLSEGVAAAEESLVFEAPAVLQKGAAG